MFPLKAANQLNQQAGKRGILWDCTSLAHALTRRAGMFPLPAANQLNQQAGKRGILWDCTSLAHTSGWDVSFASGKSIKSTGR
jgi:arginine decarboxylase-like protein